MERQQLSGTAPDLKTRSTPARLIEMQRLLDDRDETIRLLNEALSRALDDLDRSSQAA
jgi:hypothetical protein